MDTVNGGAFFAFGAAAMSGDRIAATVVGRSLAAAYADLAVEQLPEALKQLLLQLEQVEDDQIRRV